jgi:hypothetical protein
MHSPHSPQIYTYHGALEVIQAYESPMGNSARRSLLPSFLSRLFINSVSDRYLEGMTAIESSRRGVLDTWPLELIHALR